MPKIEIKNPEGSTFPDRLSSLIKESNLNQQELAEEIGCSRQSVSLYAAGKRKPDVEILNKICDYFEISSDYLLGRTSSKSLEIDNISINKSLGLNDEAIDIIKTINNCPSTLLSNTLMVDNNEPVLNDKHFLDIDILNYLITETTFIELIAQIGKYMTHNTINQVLEENFLQQYAKLLNLTIDRKYTYDQLIYYLPVVHHSNFKQLLALRKKSRNIDFSPEYEMFKMVKIFSSLIDQLFENNVHKFRYRIEVQEALKLFQKETDEDRELFIEYTLKNFKATLDAWEYTLKEHETINESVKPQNKKKEN